MVLSKFPINLLGELVAIRPNPIQSHIALPDWKRNLTGTIVATGPGCTEALPGIQAAFGAAVGIDAQFAGSPLRILKESDLDFVYEYDWAPKCLCGKYVESGEDKCTDCLDNEA